MKSKMSKYFVLAALLLASLACGETTTAEKIGEATSINPDVTATEAPAKLQVYKIGDIIKIGDMTMVVNGVSFPEPKQYFEPEEGNKFVLVDITFENQGNESETLFAMMQMTLKDDTAQEYSEDMSADISADAKAPNSEIMPGEKLRGQIGFQVPESAKGFQFVFDASLFSSGKIFVDLGE